MAEITSKRAANKENIPLSRRFNFDVDDDDFENMLKPFQPKNTQLCTLWGLKTFDDGQKNGINTSFRRYALKTC